MSFMFDVAHLKPACVNGIVDSLWTSVFGFLLPVTWVSLSSCDVSSDETCVRPLTTVTTVTTDQFAARFKYHQCHHVTSYSLLLTASYISDLSWPRNMPQTRALLQIRNRHHQTDDVDDDFDDVTSVLGLNDRFHSADTTLSRYFQCKPQSVPLYFQRDVFL